MNAGKRVEFDEHAKDYEANVDHWLKRTAGTSELYVARAKVDEFISLVKRNEKEITTLKCLDVGCGTGLIASLIKEAGIRVVGVDLSQEMIKNQSQNLREMSDYLVSDSIQLP